MTIIFLSKCDCYSQGEGSIEEKTHQKMSCDNDVNSCYDDVIGDWASERYHCLMYIHHII